MRWKAFQKKATAIAMSAVMTIGGIGIGTVSMEADAANTSVTLWYYNDSVTEDLVMNIWNHGGLEFSSSTTQAYTFGWSNKQGTLNKSADYENWYSITLDIVDASNTSEGFEIYKSSDSSSSLLKMSQQWDNTTQYATLVSGEQDAYFYKGGTLYTSMAAATGTVTPTPTPSEATNIADIYVEKIDGLSEDAIRGMDVSSYLSIQNSFDAMNDAAGSVIYGYRDYEGKIIKNQEYFTFLKNQGINYVRIRIWNNPYDSNNKGYGGGNNDQATAIILGQYATNAGMKVLVDYHCSDFWADPGKQQAPKAWSSYTLDQKKTAVNTFVSESLTELKNKGVNVGMVQIGNETNGKFCGETTWENVCALFNSGSAAVRDVDSNILVAVHFTNPEKSSNYSNIASQLNTYSVDYDVFATSYYPYWHGSLDNLSSVLGSVATTYGKKVMVAETSWANTYDDVDGHENTIKNESSLADCKNSWTISEQGQAREFRDVLNTVVSIKDSNDNVAGLGAFYWEGIWIGLQDVYNEDGTVDATKLATNKAMWETYGSGWASSYASEYDPNDAGKWYGGSAVDNQCFFDATGTARKSLEVFNYTYLSEGAKTETVEIDTIEGPIITITAGASITQDSLGTADVVYNDNLSDKVAVTWSTDDIATVNQKSADSQIGTYEVSGVVTADATTTVTATVVIKPVSLLNNYSFENDFSSSDWTIATSDGAGSSVGDKSNESGSIYEGSYALHYWDSSAGSFTATQTITLTEAGTYCASYIAHGEDTDTVKLTILKGDTTLGSQELALQKWKNYVEPTVEFTAAAGDTITYQISVTYAAEGWGFIDCAYLYRTGDVESTKFVGHSLALDGIINLEYYAYILEEDLANAQFMAYVGENLVQTLSPSDASTATYDGKTAYVFTVGVAPKDYEQTVTAKLVSENASETVVVASNEYSVSQYLTDFDENKNAYSEKTQTLVEKLDTYCLSAKQYFANETVTADYKTSWDTVKNGIGTHTISMGTNYYGSSLVLESGTILRHYYTEDFSGRTGTKNGYYYADQMIPAHQYSDTANYCVNDYIYRALNNESSTANLKNLCVALYQYGVAAKAYYDEANGGN